MRRCIIIGITALAVLYGSSTVKAGEITAKIKRLNTAKTEDLEGNKATIYYVAVVKAGTDKETLLVTTKSIYKKLKKNKSYKLTTEDVVDDHKDIITDWEVIK